MRILRAKERVATPWKNGGGTTSEIIVYPPRAGFDDFGWRVSVAEVARSGPFSLFPGTDRALALLKGRVALIIAGRGTTELTPESEPIVFPGDVPAEARVVEGPAADLNVMTRRDRFRAKVERRTGMGKLVATTDIALLFSLSGVTMLEDEMAPADALLLEHHESIELTSATEFYWIEISSRGA